MKSKIQQKIIGWIGEDMKTTDFNWPYAGRVNDKLQDLRTKAPDLAEIITHMVVEELEKHKAQHIDSIKEPFVKIALEARNDGLDEIINLLKK